jgi:hypothetical protein
MITTIVGTGASLYNGDNIPATNANLYSPAGIAIDNANNLLITDHRHHRIRKVDPSGIITTIAGNGTIGYSGDGNVATAAQLRNAIGICVDNADNVYFCDVNNSCVRRIDVDGVINTIAGTGVPGSDGDGGLATATKLGSPIGVCVSGSNLLIADGFNGRIRKVIDVVKVKPTPQIAENFVKIYPNPNNGTFTINLLTNQKYSSRIVITDIVGRVLQNINVQTNEPIPVTLDAPTGIYLITAFTNNNTVSQRINLLK